MKRFLLLLLIIIYGGFSVYTLYQQRRRPAVTILSASPIKSLRAAAEKALEGVEGTYGIAVKSLKTGEAYFLNEHQSLEAGSLYKLWVLAAVTQKIEAGELKEDESLSQSVRHLNTAFGISPEAAELTDGQVTLTVAQALTQMITISHNYATYLLVEKIGNPSIRDFLKANDLTESFLEDSPRTTPADLALFFEKLYKGQLSSPEGTRQMLDLLKKQTLNDKLSKYLPDKIDVAHKTGEIDYLTHDAGLVFSGRGDYIIAVMSESDFPPGAEERIALISKSIYDYFQANP